MLLGIDIGTSNTKGVIIDNLKVISESSIPHIIEMPKPGYFEQDAEQVWWGDIVKVCRELLHNIDVNKIEAVGVSAHCPDMLPIDKHGKALRKGVLYGIDSRAISQIEEINRKIGERKIFEVCRNVLQTQSVGPKIVWLMQNEPEIFNKTYKIHSASSYILFKLTGKHILGTLTASMFHPLFNIRKLEWDDEILSILNIPKSILPDIKWPVSIGGYLHKEASEQTGLKVGTPVITGMCDACASVFSSGLENEREMSIFMGTTTCMFLSVNNIVAHPQLWLMPYYKAGKYLFAGGTSSTGAVVQWFKDNFAENMSLKELDERAEEIEAGSNGLVVLPYFMGERTPLLDRNAKGVIFGLKINHNKAHVHRAILEATAYCIKHHIDKMKEAKVTPQKITLVNGGAKSRLWRQIISDVLGCRIYHARNAYGAPYGAAYGAGIGIGIYKDLKPLKENLDEYYIEPCPEANKKYEELYKIFLDLYPKTKEDMLLLS
jgi:xylulokinase